MDLEAVAKIERLKYRYVRALDTRAWDEFADTLTADVTAVYGETLFFESRETYVGFLENTLGSHMITEHQCSHPEIDLAEDGRSATGTWLLSDTVIIPEDELVLRGSAYYHDRYVLCGDDRWRIDKTAYERNWETVTRLTDPSSVRLTTNRWALLQQPRAS